MTCTNCGREAPEGHFCTWCGTRQAAGSAQSPRRRFAAAPNESLVSPSMLTTLFPHLGERGVNEFRWAFAVGVLVLLGLYVAGLITAAFIVAAMIVPILYVLYLYEARVYRDAPIPVMLGTIGGGFLLGVVATIVLDRLAGGRSGASETGPGSGIDIGVLLLASVAVPVVQELIKPLPALFLRNRPAFAFSIDGLVFGIAAGLGYAAAETIIHFSAVITGLPVRSEPGLWIFPLITVAILMPLLHGSATGLVTVGIWRLRGGRVPPLAVPAVLLAIGGHVAFSVGGKLIQAAGLSPVVGLIWETIVVVSLLIGIRLLLDRLLREEATELGLAESTCTNCGSEIRASGFCPVCGVALAATPHSRTSTGGAR